MGPLDDFFDLFFGESFFDGVEELLVACFDAVEDVPASCVFGFFEEFGGEVVGVAVAAPCDVDFFFFEGVAEVVDPEGSHEEDVVPEADFFDAVGVGEHSDFFDGSGDGDASELWF